MNVLFYSPVHDPYGVGTVSRRLSAVLKKEVDLDLADANYSVEYLRFYTKILLSKYDIIHINIAPMIKNLSRLFLLNLTTAPVIFNIHGAFTHERKLTRSGFIGRLEDVFAFDNIRTTCERADAIVVNSKFLKGIVSRSYAVESKKIRVIPNGVYLQETKDVNRAKNSIIFIGRLEREKGIDIAIDVLQILKEKGENVELRVVGDGSMRDYVVEKAKSLPISYYGFVSEEKKAELLRSSHFCIIPSRFEPFGIVALEAMLSGAIVVSSDSGGLKEIIKDGENGIIAGNTAREMADAIYSLMHDDRAESISKNAVAHAKNYSWENIAKRYVSLYRELI
ncbi:MAG: glycosyltransferase family 4 protein [Candidatus Micrarchaeia archaeon]